jgi:hypothetical protein
LALFERYGGILAINKLPNIKWKKAAKPIGFYYWTKNPGGFSDKGVLVLLSFFNN